MISTAHGRRPEAETLYKDGLERCKSEAKLLAELNESLHDLSQPMTVLLCALEYGGSVGLMAEMKEMFRVSQEACERLRTITTEMCTKVREAIEERTAIGESIGLNK